MAQEMCVIEMENLLDAIKRKAHEGLSKDTLYEGLKNELGQPLAEEVYAVLEKHRFPEGSGRPIIMILSKEINLDDLKCVVAELEKQERAKTTRRPL